MFTLIMPSESNFMKCEALNKRLNGAMHSVATKKDYR